MCGPARPWRACRRWRSAATSPRYEVAPMSSIRPIAVIIPTYNRGTAVHSVLEKLAPCDPQPAEIWIHVDRSDGSLERELSGRFPHVHVLSSSTQLGPGGGRHRCLLSCR